MGGLKLNRRLGQTEIGIFNLQTRVGFFSIKKKNITRKIIIFIKSSIAQRNPGIREISDVTGKNKNNVLN